MTKFIALSVSAFLLVQHASAQPRTWNDWNNDFQQRQMRQQLDDIQAQQQRMQSDLRQQQLMRQSNCIMSGNYNCP